MSSENKRIKKATRPLNLKEIEKIHPHKMLLFLFILGSSLVFLFMVLAYGLNVNQLEDTKSLRFPRAFIISAFLMMVSSFTASKFVQSYKDENIFQLRNLIAVTIGLGLLFSMCQYIGWKQLSEIGIFMTGEPAGTYLYVITGLHLFHFAGGMFFLTFLFMHTAKTSRDPIKTLIMVTNPYEKIRLEIIEIYWHFMGILWLALFFYFLFTI